MYDTHRCEDQDHIHCTLIRKTRSKKLLRCPGTSDNPHQSYFIKIYFYPGLSKITGFFYSPKGYNELSLAKRICQKGVPTIVPQEVKDIRKWGFLCKSIIVMEALPDCMNLETFFFQVIRPQDTSLKRKVIEKYAKLVRLIHDQGIYQEDFAPYNILYQQLQNNRFELYFLDLEKIRIYKKLSFEKRSRNLAKLNRAVRIFKNIKKLSNSDQMRFLKIYLGPKVTKKDITKWLNQIYLEERYIFLRDWRRAWKKSVSVSSRIGVIKYAGYHGYYRKKHLKQQFCTGTDIIQLIKAIEKTISDKITSKQFLNSSFEVTVPIKNKDEVLQVLFFQNTGFTYWLKRIVKQTPLLSEWKKDELSLRNRTANFLSVAAVEKRTGLNRFHGFLIRKKMNYIENYSNEIMNPKQNFFMNGVDSR
jgi:tRNA A-37 threonylcarbamoyl transferase component Bud32